MQLEPGLWLINAYYIDQDPHGQLRIVGPHNHLFFGSTGLYRDQLQVVSAREHEAGVALELDLTLSGGFLPDPAMGHIRQVRDLIQIVGQDERTFEQVRRNDPAQLRPNQLSLEAGPSGTHLTCLRTYGQHYYGTIIEWPASVHLVRDDEQHGYHVTASTWPVRVKLVTTCDTAPVPYHGPIFQPTPYELDRLPNGERRSARQLLDRTTAEIEHLVRYHKTSGFDYGTIFPRDWMEAADLMAPDLTPGALRHMYTMSLQHVNDDGAGWHEDIVGEFAYERNQEIEHLKHSFDSMVAPDDPKNHHFHELLRHLDELFVTRLMIDIEPHYLLGLQFVNIEELDNDSLDRLRRVARFVVGRATEQSLITFNKLALPFRRTSADEYYGAGNWRDSTMAFQQIHPVIAPYDVNAVFYPQALRIIQQHHQLLGIESGVIAGLVKKWQQVKDWYRFTNPDGTSAFALALYDVRTTGRHQPDFQMMAVNHLDEAYDLFYGQPTEAEVTSFAQRVLSPDYFYTGSGPILVGRGEGFNHSQYHGEVIWAKQAAYTIAGFERQLAVATAENWSNDTIILLKRTITSTAEACLAAFRTLNAIPELHYDAAGQARLYDDQPSPEGQMNKVQLWSAAGARRILQAKLHQFN